MSVSMDPKVRYVTQESRWSTPFTGKLTNRRIAYYQKLGYYGPVKQQEKKQKRATQNTLAWLREHYA